MSQTLQHLVCKILFQWHVHIEHEDVMNLFDCFSTEKIGKELVTGLQQFYHVRAKVWDVQDLPEYVPLPRCSRRVFLKVQHHPRIFYVSVCDGAPYVTVTDQMDENLHTGI